MTDPIKKRSFVDAVRASRPSNIYLVRGNDSTGKKAWYYVQVEPAKKRQFEISAKKGQFQLNNFGKIITSGYGDDPPASVKKRMKDEYGFEE